jgi:hypothetical protein
VPPLLEEETRQMTPAQMQRAQEAFDAASQPSLAHLLVQDETHRARLPSPDALAQAILEDETRDVRGAAPKKKKKVVTSPELLKKRQRTLTSDTGPYAQQPGPNPRDWEEEVSTEIGTPDQQAELLLKQGFVQHAIRIYKRLVESHPTDARYRARLVEIEQLHARDASPRHDSEPPTSRMSVADVKKAVAASEASGASDDIPPTERFLGTDSQLVRRAGAPVAEPNEWEDEDPTTVMASGPTPEAGVSPPMSARGVEPVPVPSRPVVQEARASKPIAKDPAVGQSGTVAVHRIISVG